MRDLWIGVSVGCFISFVFYTVNMSRPSREPETVGVFQCERKSEVTRIQLASGAALLEKGGSVWVVDSASGKQLVALEDGESCKYQEVKL